jgi:hypothetical protein
LDEADESGTHGVARSELIEMECLVASVMLVQVAAAVITVPSK